MKSLLPLLPFVAALGLIACQDGPVAEKGTAPPDNLLGDVSASGLAAPGNSAAAEAADRAALPPVNIGMAWRVTKDRRSAGFGPPGSAILSVACALGETPGLLVTRHHPTDPGAKGTISFTGSGHAASIPVAALATSGGLGRAEWQGSATGDNARAIQRSFKSTGQVEISIGGAPSLVVPADSAVRRVLANCLGA